MIRIKNQEIDNLRIDLVRYDEENSRLSSSIQDYKVKYQRYET